MTTTIDLFKQSVGSDCLHIIATQSIVDSNENISYLQPDYDFSGMYYLVKIAVHGTSLLWAPLGQVNVS